MGLRPGARQPTLRVLEVGAINTQLLCSDWLSVRAIDVLSRDPKIEQRDFFDVPIEAAPTASELYDTAASHLHCTKPGTVTAEPCAACYNHDSCTLRAAVPLDKTSTSEYERLLGAPNSRGRDWRKLAKRLRRSSLHLGGSYDVVVNSMVLNCLTDPRRRGQMIQDCYKHLRQGGLFFLMLPRRCLEQSAFISPTMLLRGLRLVGFELLHYRNTPRIALLCLRRQLLCPCACHTHASPWFASQPLPTFEDVPDHLQREARNLASTSSDVLVEGDKRSSRCREKIKDPILANAWPWETEWSEQTKAWTAPPAVIHPERSVDRGGDKSEFAISFFSDATDE